MIKYDPIPVRPIADKDGAMSQHVRDVADALANAFRLPRWAIDPDHLPTQIAILQQELERVMFEDDG